MDPVARLRAHLDGHQPADDTERAHVARLRSALDDYVAPLDEHAQPTHVTGSAIVAADDGSHQTVLLHHKRLHRWLQPGGHVEPGESVHDAALREATEETGLDLAHPANGPTLVHVHVHDGGRGHLHLDVRYVLVASPAQPFAPREGESRRLDWFADAEVTAIADDSVTVALTAARARLERLVS